MLSTLIVCATLVFAEDPLKQPAPKDFERFLEKTLEEFVKKQKKYGEKWGIDDCKRWDIDQKKGTITFTETRKGYKKLLGKVQIIGSYNSADDTWLWGWANTTVEKELQKDARKLKEYGEKNKITRLSDKGFKDAEMSDGWKMVALAVKLLGADGAYRGPAGKLFVFMVIRDLQVVEE